MAILAKDVIKQDPMSVALFAFINVRRNKLKLLVWEKSGFIVWYKRLERAKMHWPPHLEKTVLTLTGERISWLLDGYDVLWMKPYETVYFSVFS